MKELVQATQPAGVRMRAQVSWTLRPELISIMALLICIIKFKLAFYMHMYLSAYNFLTLWENLHNSQSSFFFFFDNCFRVLVRKIPRGYVEVMLMKCS